MRYLSQRMVIKGVCVYSVLVAEIVGKRKEIKRLIYRMSKKLFTELSKSLNHDGRDANEKEVAVYVNQTFGLIHDITELRLI